MKIKKPMKQSSTVDGRSMQVIDWNAFFFLGFTVLVLFSYIVVRTTSKGKDRLTDCYGIFAIGMIVEQISALYWGNYFGAVVEFYVMTSLLFAPAVVFIIIDLIVQILSRNKPLSNPKRISIDIE